MNAKIYFDMDGVLALFSKVPFEVVCRPGYFYNRPPMEDMVKAVKMLLESDIGDSVAIRSAVLSEEAADEKRRWLKKYLPELKENSIEFVQCGTDKSDGLDFEDTRMYLIDDFSYNLHNWKGVGIKVYNGINGTNGTWKGYSVSAEMPAQLIFRQLYGILKTDITMSA